MHGDSANGINARGVIPRAMEVVFGKKQEESDAGTGRIELSLSCLEIYQEKLFDLLEDTKVLFNSTNKNLRIRQRQNGEVWVEVSLLLLISLLNSHY